IDGEKTTKPNFAELLLPFGDYKGYVIAFMIEILSSVLSDAFQGKNVGVYNSLENGQGVGHNFIAIYPSNIISQEKFQNNLRTFVNQIYESKKGKEAGSILLPGEKEYIIKRERMKKGIPIPEKLYLYLKAHCKSKIN